MRKLLVHSISYMMFGMALTACQPSSSSSDAKANNQSASQNHKSAIKKPEAKPASEVASVPIPIITLKIAASSNLKTVLPILQTDFNQRYPNIKLSVDYTKSVIHYEKIQRRPNDYDVFLSANSLYVESLYKIHTNSYSKPFIYTQGQLVLYSTLHSMDHDPTLTLDTFAINHSQFRVVMPDPTLAPYGAAASTWLVNQNLANSIMPNVVTVDGLDQAFEMVDNGNADFGFVALSQILSKPISNTLHGTRQQLNYSILPKSDYPAILQEGIILQPSETANTFKQYLLSAKAQGVFTDAGYLPICTTSTLLPACK